MLVHVFVNEVINFVDNLENGMSARMDGLNDEYIKCADVI